MRLTIWGLGSRGARQWLPWIESGHGLRNCLVGPVVAKLGGDMESFMAVFLQRWDALWCEDSNNSKTYGTARLDGSLSVLGSIG